MKQNCHLFMIISLALLLTGCWDRIEINDLAYVVATGVDKGKKDTYRFSVQIPLPSSLGGTGSSGGGGGTSGEGPFFIAQGTGGNLRQGMEDIQTRLSRKIYFGHRRVLIIGEELASKGVMETLNEVFIQPQSRISTYLLISKGDAVKLLETQPRMEQYSGEAIREMAKANLGITVKDVIEDINRPWKEPIIPLIEPTGMIKKDKNGKEILMSSFAIFKGDKLSFTTNKKESQGVLWLLEKMKKKAFTFKVAKNREITVQIIDNNLDQKLNIVNGKPTFNLKIRVTGTLLENEPDFRLEDPETYHMVIGKMEQEVKSNIRTILDHSHSQGVDVNGFGWYLYKTHHQKWISNWEKDWENTLADLKVSIKVDADIQRMTNSGRIEKD